MRSLVFLTATLFASISEAATLDIVVEGLETKGRLRLALVDSEDTWRGKGEPLVGINARVTASTMKFRFEVPAGKMAVRLYHDENANGELDSNMLGIPKEGYGFSNNPKVMGPAGFKDAVFTVTAKGTTTVIKVN